MIYCKAVPGATIYKITRFYLNIDHLSINRGREPGGQGGLEPPPPTF